MNKNVFLTCEEMYPQLNVDSVDKFFNFIQEDVFKEFLIKCYDKVDKDLNDVEYENKVCEILLDHLITRGLLDVNAGHQVFVDCLLVSVFLHNLFFDEKDIIGSVMKARIEFSDIAEELQLPEQIQEAIWDGIESQLGDATPVKKLKPSPNTPQSLLADCIYITRNLHKWIK